MEWEGFREHPIDLIGPATVMLDNLINNLSYVSLLTLLATSSSMIDCVGTGMVSAFSHFHQKN
jgi:hypothetical protein